MSRSFAPLMTGVKWIDDCIYLRKLLKLIVVLNEGG